MAATRADSVYVPESFNLQDEDVAKLNQDVNKIKKRKRGGDNTLNRGVVYLGHIPNGFFEPQMKKFFGQFGKVTRLRLSRSKKTGRSKGFAFIEFQHKDVAEIVASTMNNYLMFMRLLKCEFLSPDKVHPDTFKGCHKKFSAPKASELAVKRHNSVKTEKVERRARRRQTKKLQKLAILGINMDFGQQEKQVCQSPVPDVVNTPGGKLQVLKEDASDTEVTFKTPPGAVKSSRLPTTPKGRSSSAKKPVKQLKPAVPKGKKSAKKPVKRLRK